MAWNKTVGRPWDPWELDVLIEGRQASPPVPYREIMKKLPSDRTMRGAMRVAFDMGLTKRDFQRIAKTKHLGREEEILEILDYCAVDLRMSREQARGYMAKVKGIPLSPSAFNKRVADLRHSDKFRHKEIYRHFKLNGQRVRSHKLSRTKRSEYKQGKTNLIPGGNRRGKHTGVEGKGQDQETHPEVRGLLRTASNAGHGAERHA